MPGIQSFPLQAYAAISGFRHKTNLAEGVEMGQPMTALHQLTAEEDSRHPQTDHLSMCEVPDGGTESNHDITLIWRRLATKVIN